VQTSGSPLSLREGAIGRLSGIDTYESQVFGGVGGAVETGADGVAFHRQAVALVSRTLQAPEGLPASQVSVQDYKGLGLRVLKSFDINKKQDIVSIDWLFGTTTMRKEAAIELDFGQGS
jgi:hypothetical protein